MFQIVAIHNQNTDLRFMTLYYLCTTKTESCNLAGVEVTKDGILDFKDFLWEFPEEKRIDLDYVVSLNNGMIRSLKYKFRESKLSLRDAINKCDSFFKEKGIPRDIYHNLHNWHKEIQNSLEKIQ